MTEPTKICNACKVEKPLSDYHNYHRSKDGKQAKRKGRTFKSFINALKRQGYQVDWKELRACNFGAPTIRKRLFLIARRDGQPITWPKPTHGAPDSLPVKSGKLLPYRTAAECIDWSIPCPSIFDRKRPLAENTMRRIALGIQKFVLDNPDPFIVTCNHSGQHFRGQSLQEPMKTITASRDAHGLVSPVLSPFIATLAHGEGSGKTKRWGTGVREIDQSLPTITASGGYALVAPFITEHANASNQRNIPIDEPLRTQCAAVKGGHFAMVAPVIARQFGNSIGHSPLSPLGTITSGGGGKSQLVTAHLSPQYGGGYQGAGQPILKPVPTITGIDHNALVTSNLIKLRGTNTGSKTDEPMHTITAGGLHIGEVRAFILKYYGTNIGHKVDEPLQTITAKHRFGLVTVKGETYQIVDIGMRMLQPHELFKAQGFPDDYIIDVDHTGKRYPKTKQVARCGNAVPPPFAEHLVKANLPEMCQGGKLYDSVSTTRGMPA